MSPQASLRRLHRRFLLDSLRLSLRVYLLDSRHRYPQVNLLVSQQCNLLVSLQETLVGSLPLSLLGSPQASPRVSLQVSPQVSLQDSLLVNQHRSPRHSLRANLQDSRRPPLRRIRPRVDLRVSLVAHRRSILTLPLLLT